MLELPGSEGSCSSCYLFVLLCHRRVEYGYVLDMIVHELKAQSQLLVLLGGDSGNFQAM